MQTTKRIKNRPISVSVNPTHTAGNTQRVGSTTLARLDKLRDKVNVLAHTIETSTKPTRLDPTRRQAKRAAHTKADKARYHQQATAREAGASRAGRKVTSRQAAYRRWLRSNGGGSQSWSI